MKKNINLEVMRFLAVIAVILIHMTMSYYHDKNLMVHENKIWIYEQIIYTSTRFCVPFFFIITAYLAFNNMSSKSLAKRVSRVIIPFIFWSVIYYLYFGWEGVSDFALKLITSYTSFHLWFIPVFIGYCIFLPMVVDLFSGDGKEKYKYIFYLSFAFSIAVPTLDLVARMIDKSYDKVLGLSQFGLALPQYLLYAVAFPYFHRRVKVGRSFIFYALLLMINIIANVRLSEMLGEPNEYFYAFPSLIVFISSYLLFNIIISVNFSGIGKYYESFIRKVGELSFGIYLTHWLVYCLLEKYGFIVKERALAGPAINTMTVFTVSLIIVYIISRFKVIRKVTM